MMRRERKEEQQQTKLPRTPAFPEKQSSIDEPRQKLDLSMVHKDSRLSRDDLLKLKDKRSPTKRCLTSLTERSDPPKGFECTFANTSSQNLPVPNLVEMKEIVEVIKEKPKPRL